MAYHFPFGQEVHPVVQEDRTPKKVFVLGVYASAVHAKWEKDGKVICQALAVASEPRIFWNGDEKEAKSIIEKIYVPKDVGELVPAGKHLNGPSAKVLDEKILAPLGFERKDAWLCDLLPETRLNQSQVKAVKYKYNPLIEQYRLNAVTIPQRPNVFCGEARCKEIVSELMKSEAKLLILLGDKPIKEFLTKVADVSYDSLQKYVDLFGYGNTSEVVINGNAIQVMPLAHPRQIGGLGRHSEKWNQAHMKWYESTKL